MEPEGFRGRTGIKKSYRFFKFYQNFSLTEIPFIYYHISKEARPAGWRLFLKFNMKHISCF